MTIDELFFDAVPGSLPGIKVSTRERSLMGDNFRLVQILLDCFNSQWGGLILYFFRPKKQGNVCLVLVLNLTRPPGCALAVTFFISIPIL